MSVLPATVRSLRPSLLLLFLSLVLGSFVSSVLGSASDGVLIAVFATWNYGVFGTY